MYTLKAGFVYRSVVDQDGVASDWEINFGRPHGKEVHIGMVTIDGVQCALFSDGVQEIAQSVRLAKDVAVPLRSVA